MIFLQGQWHRKQLHATPMVPIQRSRTPALPGAWPDVSMSSLSHANIIDSISASGSGSEVEAAGGRVAAKHSFLNVPSPTSRPSSVLFPPSSPSATMPNHSVHSSRTLGGLEEPLRDDRDVDDARMKPAKLAGTPSTFGVRSPEQSYFRPYDVGPFLVRSTCMNADRAR